MTYTDTALRLHLQRRLDAIEHSAAPHEQAEARRIRFMLAPPGPALLELTITRHPGRPALDRIELVGIPNVLLPTIGWSLERDVAHREVVVLRLAGDMVHIRDFHE